MASVRVAGGPTRTLESTLNDTFGTAEWMNSLKNLVPMRNVLDVENWLQPSNVPKTFSSINEIVRPTSEETSQALSLLLSLGPAPTTLPRPCPTPLPRHCPYSSPLALPLLLSLGPAVIFFCYSSPLLQGISPFPLSFMLPSHISRPARPICICISIIQR
jgi:hypothetical protein